ncbi:iron-containing alcohol dehydrogenase [soil metagenome]
MASLVRWSFPTTIVFGAGALASLPEHGKTLGKHALVVADPGVRKAGLVDAVVKTLTDAGLGATVFDHVDPNPIEKNVFDGVAVYKESGADFIVAVGGGSPLDTAKLIALKTTHDRPLVDYDEATGGDAFITANVPAIITIPTTAGTGSEVGRSGVVTLAANGRKTVIFSPYLLARVAILDPALTVSMPPKITASTGFDALTHCLEAYVSLGDHPMADGIALEGLALVSANLERAVSHGTDLEARGGMMKAAMMGAVAFQKGLGACHSLAHPLSSEKGMHHGLANALCLPAVIAWNDSVVHDKLERVKRIFDANAKDAATAIVDLRKKIGLPNGLGAEGITKADIEKLSEKAIEDACHRSNPRPTTREDLAALYEASL